MPENNERRFADSELIQLRKDFEQHEREQETSLGLLADMVRENTKAVDRIAEAVKEQTESTAGVVQLYNDIKGSARVGMGVQKFIAWLASLGVIGAALGAAVLYLLDHFAPPPS